MKFSLVIISLLLPSLAFSQNSRFDQEAEQRIKSFKVENNFTVELFADQEQVINPSAICFDDKGSLFVGEIHRWRAGVEDIRHHIPMLVDDLSIVTSEDRLAMYRKHSESGYLPFERWTEFSDAIRLIEDRDGDGRADKSTIWADDFDDPLDGPGIGLVYGDGKLFYTNIPHLWALSDGDGDGKAEQRESIQDGFGVRMSISGHDMHGAIFGPDGRLYWSIGDRGYTIETKEGKTFSEPTEGAVFRCEPDGSNVEVYYLGLRNPQELAFDAYGNLFTCDNDADAKDTGRLVYLLEGGDSGWDAGHQVLLNFHEPLNLRTPYYPKSKFALNMWLDERIWEKRNEEQPAWILPPIELVSWGPSGLVYNYGATSFPKKYENHFWVCNFGGAKGDLEMFSMKPQGAGFKIDTWKKEWMVGLGVTDAEFGPDGKLYISCFNNNGWVKQDVGNIYTMFDPKGVESPIVQETEALLTGGLKEKKPEELVGLLSHADMRVRLQSQFALAKLGMKAMPMFQAAADQTENQLQRLHGIWGLGQVMRQTPATSEFWDDFWEWFDVEDPTPATILEAYLADKDAEVRAQAAKTLGDLRAEESGPALTKLLKDDSLRVRSFAAIGVGRLGYKPALSAVVEMLAENADKDAFLRHAGVLALAKLKDRGAVLALAEHDSKAVRLASALVLRRWKDAEIARYLKDSDPGIVAEAIRAINDLNLVAAIPQLAEKINDSAAFPAKKPADWMLHTRLINANWRYGDAESAKRLFSYASQESLPLELRNDALQSLEAWSEPGDVDPTIARVMPVESERAEISEIAKVELPKIFPSASGEMLATALRLAAAHGLEVDSEVLMARLTNEKAGVPVRIEALNVLKAREEAGLVEVLEKLMNDSAPEIRAATNQALLELDPEKGVVAALDRLRAKSHLDRQNAIELLAPVEDPRVTAEFANAIKQATTLKYPFAALLELLEAAENRSDLKEEYNGYLASLEEDDPVSKYRECLDGGDIKRGETLFATHAAGQCNKCHKVGPTGGIAGPDLSDMGKRGDKEYILTSLVAPSAHIVPGYGLTMAMLKDGTSCGGNLLEETDDKIVIRVGEDETREISKSEILSMNPPMSAMPPMGILLSKRELRDLVAYLEAQKSKPEAGH